MLDYQTRQVYEDFHNRISRVEKKQDVIIALLVIGITYMIVPPVGAWLAIIAAVSAAIIFTTVSLIYVGGKTSRLLFGKK